MNRDYTDYPERNSEHIVQNEHNEYQDKFFHDIDLAFLLDAIQNIELEGYSLNIVNNKLQLLDNDGDVVSEVDISQGSQGPVGPTPNISMNASVDSNIGTPSVEIVKTGTAESPVFSLAFHNLKGQKGDPGQDGQSIVGPPGQSGQDGVTPNVSATASVDSNTGIPGVTVTRTGTAENPVFNFAFTNIKGATGAASTVPGPQGEPGTPFQVKAQYDTWADFIAAHPTGQVGDAYQVGSNDEYYTKSEVNTIVGNIRQVPAIAAGDAGKVLSVNSGETGVEWATPSGGGSNYALDICKCPESIWDGSSNIHNFESVTITMYDTNFNDTSVTYNASQIANDPHVQLSINDCMMITIEATYKSNAYNSIGQFVSNNELIGQMSYIPKNYGYDYIKDTNGNVLAIEPSISIAEVSNVVKLTMSWTYNYPTTFGSLDTYLSSMFSTSNFIWFREVTS